MSSKSYTDSFNTTNQIDNSQNLADSKILGAGAIDTLGNVNQLAAGAIMADEVNRTDASKTNSENIAISGMGSVTANITQFGENAANVISDAFKSVENIAAASLQHTTDKSLLQTEVSDNQVDMAELIIGIFDKPAVKIGAGVIAAGFVYLVFFKKGKK